VGKPRAAAVAPRLAELNPLVKVEATSDALDEDLVARHDAVIVTSGLKQVRCEENVSVGPPFRAEERSCAFWGLFLFLALD
jgi:hypothetical protein